MKAKCKNCGWDGEVSGEPAIGKKGEEQWFCSKCGDVVEVKDKKPEPELDLNDDGKVDEKDARIASKVMNRVRWPKKKTTTKKKTAKKRTK